MALATWLLPAAGAILAAALIIGLNQLKNLTGIPIPRSNSVFEILYEAGAGISATHLPTLAMGLGGVLVIVGLRKWSRRIPGGLIAVVLATAITALLALHDSGVAIVGDVPAGLPAPTVAFLDWGAMSDLLPIALAISLVGYMESIAVAKSFAAKHRATIEPSQELTALGMANLVGAFFQSYPTTGGFSRTAVNDTAGARTPLASIITAGIVLATIAFFTPLLSSLPNAALGAIIIMAVIGLIDVKEMRHIAAVKRSDLIGLTVAFVATLALGIELGIAVAVAASMLVVFARMSRPHTAVLGQVPGTTTYRNVERFPEVEVVDGIRIIRIDAALSFVNADPVKKLLIDQASQITEAPRALVLDASGINDVDATGAEMLNEVLNDLDERGVALHLTDVKGPVRDVLRRAGIWSRSGTRIHASTHVAVQAICTDGCGPADQRRHGIDERGDDALLGHTEGAGEADSESATTDATDRPEMTNA